MRLDLFFVRLGEPINLVAGLAGGLGFSAERACQIPSGTRDGLNRTDECDVSVTRRDHRRTRVREAVLGKLQRPAESVRAFLELTGDLDLFFPADAALDLRTFLAMVDETCCPKGLNCLIFKNVLKHFGHHDH